MLKLNQDKTELSVFAPCEGILDGTIVTNTSFVKTLDIFFDRTLCMQKQASAITKSFYFQIRYIEVIRLYTTEDARKPLVCSLVTSCFDYGKVVLYGVHTNIISKLQRVQNTAARLITRRKKHDHITSVLMPLH